MAKSAAERQRKRRQIIKQDHVLYEALKREDRRRKSVTKLLMTDDETTKLRLATKLAMRKSREKSKSKLEKRETPMAILHH